MTPSPAPDSGPTPSDSPSDPRARARALATSGHPLLWFEKLYRESEDGDVAVPWADLRPQPLLVDWLDRRSPGGERGSPPRALVVGSGFGDDAEELSRRGWSTVAFDIAPTAIEACRRRYPESSVDYRVANLIDAPPEWSEAFDLVIEVFTLQVLPESLRALSIRNLARFPRAGGTLLVICRGREEGSPAGELPWPLTPTELSEFETHGLSPVRFEDLHDDEDPPVRRFRAEYRNEGGDRE